MQTKAYGGNILYACICVEDRKQPENFSEEYYQLPFE